MQLPFVVECAIASEEPESNGVVFSGSNGKQPFRIGRVDQFKKQLQLIVAIIIIKSSKRRAREQMGHQSSTMGDGVDPKITVGRMRTNAPGQNQMAGRKVTYMSKNPAHFLSFALFCFATLLRMEK